MGPGIRVTQGNCSKVPTFEQFRVPTFSQAGADATVAEFAQSRSDIKVMFKVLDLPVMKFSISLGLHDDNTRWVIEKCKALAFIAMERSSVQE